MLGFWAKAEPAASTQIRIFAVGVIFIPSLLLLHRCSGLAGRVRRIQIMAEIRGRQTSGYNALTRRVLIAVLRLRVARLSGCGHEEGWNIYDALDFFPSG